ncbi:MAG: sigma factor-like helix-turn-helix DNA-binding protein [Chthoniobacteraceae bacterium]
MSTPADNFVATRWTLVARASGGDAGAQTALSELCAAYYAPVNAFLRAEGRTEDAARELAHEFFARLLAGGALGGADAARGRFRSYLLGALKHFLTDHRLHANREKRGGGIAPEPLDTGTNAGLPLPAACDDDRIFDRQWALTLIARALEIVGGELREAGKAEHFDALKPWLTGESAALSQAEAAQQLGVSEGAVKVAVHRLRQRFREAIKAEIAQTVPNEADVDDELRHLLAVLVAQ